MSMLTGPYDRKKSHIYGAHCTLSLVFGSKCGKRAQEIAKRLKLNTYMENTFFSTYGVCVALIKNTLVYLLLTAHRTDDFFYSRHSTCAALWDGHIFGNWSELTDISVFLQYLQYIMKRFELKHKEQHALLSNLNYNT